jgi:hypothetical protein
MKLRKSEWSEEDLKQLAAIVAVGGTPLRAAAKFKRTMASCRKRARKKLACRLRIRGSGGKRCWQRVRRIKKGSSLVAIGVTRSFNFRHVIVRD